MELYFIILIVLGAILAVCIILVICAYCCGDYCYCREETSYTRSRDLFGGETGATVSARGAYRSEHYSNSSHVLLTSIPTSDLETNEQYSTPLLLKDTAKPPPLGFRYLPEEAELETKETSSLNPILSTPDRLLYPVSNGASYPPNSGITETYPVETHSYAPHPPAETHHREAHFHPQQSSTETYRVETRSYPPNASVETHPVATHFYPPRPFVERQQVETHSYPSQSSTETHRVETCSYPSHSAAMQILSFNTEISKVSHAVATSPHPVVCTAPSSAVNTLYSTESQINSTTDLTRANSHRSTNVAPHPSPTRYFYPPQPPRSETTYASENTLAHPSSINATLKSVEQLPSTYSETVSHQSQTVGNSFRKHPSEVSLYDNM